MPYQVTFNKAGGGRGRGRTSTAYRLKPDTQTNSMLRRATATLAWCPRRKERMIV